ncbi:MAG: methylenetetrahydrofolate--tRNA-(uracil(54)-C(5))-methyltransferase (FADH(2)-oxidizing) TrmFO [Lentisphaeria bacterium]|nr:methylenetetrahydrofolate--tRNA-(uracil(54)-C(5))-methyltransferase (FADH(2)-oxidizing) TrmFO [Lentisphaeria bacterium]
MTGIANTANSKGAVIVGAGLAGSEAAWQVARRGVPCVLYEMRPGKTTPAHQTALFAELVCSNSLGSALPDRATGLLQEEMTRLESLVLTAARATRVEAGGALAVDRGAFAEFITEKIEAHPGITVIREEVTAIPEDRPTVLATGPLTSDTLCQDIIRVTGRETLAFYDAMAPVINADSIDMTICFKASRYDRGDSDEGDYINCPLDKDAYDRLVEALVSADKAPLRDFETDDPNFFEGCLPVEELARRGHRTLAFGPLRPVGLTDPRTDRWPYAVIQLRRDNLAGTLYNMVGFQTNLTYGEQKRVFRLIPGLGNADFFRLGQMHRNTFIKAPALLDSHLRLRSDPGVFIAGQLSGAEGYIGNVATGWLAGVNAARQIQKKSLVTLPLSTMSGALINYLVHSAPEDFQPMKANFGLLPRPDPPVKGKRERYGVMSARALEALEAVKRETWVDA